MSQRGKTSSRWRLFFGTLAVVNLVTFIVVGSWWAFAAMGACLAVWFAEGRAEL